MPEQAGLASMELLQAIEHMKRLVHDQHPSEICDLFRFLDDPTSDDALIPIATDTVRNIMIGDPNWIFFGLCQGQERTLSISVSLAEKLQLCDAGPFLIRHIKTSRNTNILPNLIQALTHLSQNLEIETLRPLIFHSDTLVGITAVKALATQENSDVLPLLIECLDQEEEFRSHEAAILLGKIGGIEAVKGLIRHIHNPSPNVRRVVAESLINIGDIAIKFLCDKLQSSQTDEVILTANILGELKTEAGINALADAMIHANPNVRFSIVEALGKINSEAAVDALTGGLVDEDYSVVCAAVLSVNNNLKEHLLKKLILFIQKNKKIRDRILNAITEMEAVDIFSELQTEKNILLDILTRVKICNNKATLFLFLKACTRIKEPAVRKGAEMILNKAIKDLPDIKARILAADDSRAVRNFYHAALSKLSFHVVMAEDGLKAMEEFDRDNAFDLIITDMNMPNKNGIEVIKHIRKKNQTIPILLVSTESEKEQVQTAMAEGADNFITKPVSEEKLQETTRSMIQG